MKTFYGLKCSVTPHSSLNTSKRIILCPALNRVTSDDIKKGMVKQGVTDVRRISVRRDGVIKLTNTYVLTFNSPNLTIVVKIGFMQVKVDVYIPNPLRCYNCQVFAYHENKCGTHPVCCNCCEWQTRQMWQLLRWSPCKLKTMPTMGERKENSQNQMWKKLIISWSSSTIRAILHRSNLCKCCKTRHLQQIYINWQQKHTDRRQLFRILKTTSNRENTRYTRKKSLISSRKK